MLKRALIVDDSRLARLTLKRLLAQYDIEVSEAEGVIEAEQWIMHNMLPDLVFMDVMMPEIDGFEGLDRLRTNPDTRQVPVIMYSGDISEEARRKARDHGATGYLPKPADSVRLDHLLNALNKRQAQKQAQMPQTEEETAAAAPEEAKPVERKPEPAKVADPITARYQPPEIPRVSARTAAAAFPQMETLVVEKAVPAISEDMLRRLTRLEERVSLQDSSTAHLDLSAEVERQRRDVVYLQRHLSRAEQWMKIGLLVGAVALLVGLAAIFRQVM